MSIIMISLRILRRQRMLLPLLLLFVVFCVSLVRYLPEDRTTMDSFKYDSGDNYMTKITTHRIEKPVVSAANTTVLSPAGTPVIPVLIMGCDRPLIARCISSVLKHRPSTSRFPVIVSQDCVHQETSDAIRRFGDSVTYIMQPDQSAPEIEPGHGHFLAYYRIARHYKWAFNHLFNSMEYKQLVVIEDDMEVSPDFFHYFEAFLPVLRSDPTLMCVSAWNDNGKGDVASDPSAFYRSDFFPGLGWMLSVELWKELSVKWPRSFWDDWLRKPANRRSRQCIRPEISRVLNFGRAGASNGEYFDEHIGRIKINSEIVTYTGYNPDKLVLTEGDYALLPVNKNKSIVVDVRFYLKGNYEKQFRRQVYELATEVSDDRMAQITESPLPVNFEEFRCNLNLPLPGNDCGNRNVSVAEKDSYCGRDCLRRFRIVYQVNSDSDEPAKNQVSCLQRWGLMHDIRSDITRTSYFGVVIFKLRQKATKEIFTVYSAPAVPLT